MGESRYRLSRYHVCMADLLFATLAGKTFALLGFALLVTYLGAHGIIEYFYRAALRGASYATLGKNSDGEPDVIPAPHVVQRIFWPLLILNIIAFLFLLFVESMGVRLFAFLLFALTDGLTIGLVLLSMNERLGIRVLLLTALATLVAGSIGYYGDLNLAWLGTYLFFALLAMIAISFVRIFVHITGWKRRLIASIGILIFIGYLLYDFSALKAARGVEALNNWATALDFSVSIYLDVINLFLQILDALSSD